MKIAILGADGFYGYPLSQRLSKRHTVLKIDNFWRRSILESPSLLPREKDIDVFCDITNYNDLFLTLQKFEPDFVIHLAEQRSAPYSMKNIQTKQFTIQNNSLGSLNLMECAKILKFSTIHIGTMGVYGYSKNKLITEGDTVRSPGSIYHLSKCIDNSIFEFYNRLYDCSITELHQGIIWGIGGRFDYDESFGTVLNRFILQDMLNIPLTMYGKGTQLRPFIYIDNSLDCIELIINNFKPGFHTYNQFTEIRQLKSLLNVQYTEYKNPRIEKEDNTLISTNQKLLDLGLKPILINEAEIDRMKTIIEPYIKNVKKELIYPKTGW